MACACKVNRQIDYLHKKYGDKQPVSKTTDIVNRMEVKMENGIAYLLMIPLIPFMIIYVVWNTVRRKPIRIDKLFKISRR